MVNKRQSYRRKLNDTMNGRLMEVQRAITLRNVIIVPSGAGFDEANRLTGEAATADFDKELDELKRIVNEMIGLNAESCASLPPRP